MQVGSDSLGSYLRQERERQRLSLHDVAAATKIQLKFLEALERDAYEQLPAPPFVVGFLRAYAQCIALDPDPVLAAYRALHRAPEPQEVAPRPEPLPEPSWPRRRLVRLGAFVVAGSLVAGVVFYEVRRGQPARQTVTSFPATLPDPAVPVAPPARPILPTPARNESVPPPATVAPAAPGLSGARVESSAPSLAPAEATSPAVPAAPSGATVAHARGPSEAAGSLVLQATAVSDTWLQVEIDGEKRQPLLLASGKSVQWEAQDRFRLTVGNAKGTRLALNGQDIPLQSGRSNVVRDFLLTRALLQ